MHVRDIVLREKIRHLNGRKIRGSLFAIPLFHPAASLHRRKGHADDYTTSESVMGKISVTKCVLVADPCDS